MDKSIRTTRPLPSAEYIHQLREPVAVHKQANFFLYARRLRALVYSGRIRLDEQRLIDEIDEVILADEPSEERLRRVFGCLACTNSILALRALEEAMPSLSGSKREWALLAELQLRMSVIGDLVGEQQVALTSGLGGEGTLVRLNGVLVSQGKAEWQPYQKKLIHDELEKACREATGRLESEVWGAHYYIFVILLPYTSDITGIVRAFIDEVNAFGSFIIPDSLLTNIETLSEQDASAFAEELYSGKTNDSTPPPFDETDL